MATTNRILIFTFFVVTILELKTIKCDGETKRRLKKLFKHYFDWKLGNTNLKDLTNN
jgi:hypothetical protein